MKNKIIEYNILTEDNVMKLRDFVSSQIGLGWEPIGGPFIVSQMCNITTFGQAMIYRTKLEKNK
jgi:hypothetical protein